MSTALRSASASNGAAARASSALPAAHSARSVPAPAGLAKAGPSATAQRSQRPPAALREASVNNAPAALRPVLAGQRGDPLALPLRHTLERSLGADLAAVRVHQGAQAAAVVDAAGARALAYGTHILLGRREQASDLRLLAHEVAHVLQQQGGAGTVQASGGPHSGDALEHEADRTAAAVVAGRPAVVTGRSAPKAQFSIGSALRSGLSAVGGAVSSAAGAVVGAVGDIVGLALGFVRDHARLIPGYDLLGFILGRDPITQQSVDRNPVTLIRALMGLWPGGSLVYDALQRYGIVDRVGGWLQTQINSLGAVVGAIRSALDRFLRTLGVGDIANLGGVWDRARAIFSEPIGRAFSFVTNLASQVLGFIRDAVLRPLARLAEGTRGYDLLRLVLGQDPITSEPYPRTAENLIGGFMRLIGQEEKWRYLQESRAIPRAWAWFQAQMGTLMGFVARVPGLFVQAWQSLQISDLLNLPGAFARLAGIFGGFVMDFLRWAADAALQLMMFIFEVLAPGAMPILRRAASVLRTIFGDPIRFVGHLVRAGIQGFRQFFTNIRTHLVSGLVGWITGALGGAGLTLPTTWDLRGILSLVLQILGLTWQNIRAKLVRVTSERAVLVLETGFDIVVALVRDGPMAAWQRIVEQLATLRDTVLGGVRDWVISTVVSQAVLRIASMLNPAGAVIQAIIAIYNTIMFVRERLQQIMAVAESFFNSIAAIAAGQIGAAADRVEQTMGRLVPVVISFLARLLGLGGISDTIRNIIARIRAPIERALDWLVNWIATQARRLVTAVASGARAVVARVTNWWAARRSFRAADGEHQLYIEGSGANRRVMLASTPAELRARIAAMVVPADKAANRANALRILGLIEAAMRAAAGTGPAALEAGDRIDGLMGQLAPETAQIMGAGAAGTSTPPLFGGPGPGNFGSTVTVERLTPAHEAGSGPSRDDGSWATLRQRMDGGSTYYVRGHLLNDNLGGTGAAWTNLTPLTQATNNRSVLSMLHTFENSVKNAVAAGDSVNLTVAATYGRPTRAAEVSALRASGDAEDATKADIISAEVNVPTAVRCVAHRINAAGTRSALVSSNVNNTVDSVVDHYSLGGRPRVTVRLNDPAAPLRTLAGVGPAEQTRIVAARPFSGRDDAIARLGGTLWHNMVSTAGIRVRAE